ncbi:hypothetical protein ACRQ5Q_22285 [Bradyrhizobium sp. PMVTL-01]|uniref:hypothetical protein n=1 Tax=Bradyrhizobium sp. PMVTL-01 TaxID=3434999 RepID=UPI003F72E1B0
MPEPVSLIKPSYAAGELSPSIWGRTDFAKWNIGASVYRNCFVSYRGPASSRGGLLWCGKSLTPASPSSLPPKLVRFQFNIFQSYLLEFGADATGRTYMRVVVNGAYVLDTTVPITGATQANPCVLHVPGHTFNNGDWAFVDGVQGMAQLDSTTFIVANAVPDFISLQNIFGIPVNSLAYDAYAAGGTISKIYTTFSSPYALKDLKYLKVVQSADVMTLCCVNQEDGTEYPPIDLQRLAANNWNFEQTTFASSIAAPTGVAAVYNGAAPTTATQYAYVVTAIDATTGDESVASSVAYITNSDDISAVAGSHTITWDAVANAAYYNVYQAPPSYDAPVPVGVSFGYIGQAYGTQFVNTNIVADQAKTPPQHNNPFARGQVVSCTAVATGAAYVQATTTATIISATGTGATLAPVVVGGAVVAIIVKTAGQDYKAGDAIVIADSGGGAGANYTLNVGAQSGTYPSVPGYFQSRRLYAATINNPDTLFGSQTGSYTNMDSSVPPIDSDAIIATPWGQQVNGVQALQPMPGGLIVATGLDAWQVSGAGGAGSAWTPSSQSAQPQETIGFAPTVPPLKIGYDILFNQSLGYVIRDIQYNFINNIYAGDDISILSNHLFDGYEILGWAWAQVPWKIVWAYRDDGRFLSLTYDKKQELQGWSRHDTNGLVEGVASATEPPVDAPYFVVKRYIRGVGQWAYYIERMDNRLWFGPEDPRCVDAHLTLAQPAPDAALTASAAEGPGDISGAYLANGGQGYTAPVVQVIDPLGLGSGAVITLTAAAGVITAFDIVSQGEDYSPSTYAKIVDATGAGGTLVLLVSQNVTFEASAAVFAADDVGAVIRIGGGQATVQSVQSPTSLTAAVTVPIINVMPNDPHRLPIPAPSGKWTITQPVAVISNLGHLEGMTVTGLADGVVIPPVTVENGQITLDNPASSVVVGLPFIAQLQAMPVEIPQAGTVQGDRKVISGVGIRMEKTRGIQIGANQPVPSTLDFFEEIAWSNLSDLDWLPRQNVPDAALPLFTGDKFTPIADDWQNWNGFEAAPGMVCAQQLLPLPMNILAFMPKVEVGDR